jgi:putative oxidoreductase
MYPLLSVYLDIALLLMRFMVAAVFIWSGVQDLLSPDKRAKDLGINKALTILLGIAEIAGGAGVALGILTQAAAAGLIIVMLGAIYKKALVWKTGFWGKGNQGWHYEVMIITMNLVILTANGGRYTLWM